MYSLNTKKARPQRGEPSWLSGGERVNRNSSESFPWANAYQRSTRTRSGSMAATTILELRVGHRAAVLSRALLPRQCVDGASHITSKSHCDAMLRIGFSTHRLTLITPLFGRMSISG